MSERRYQVTVTQALEKIHVVRASSQREAREIIKRLIENDLDDDSIIDSFGGTVGPEKIIDVRRES